MSAVQTVLSSPDLVALILERLPVTQLGFGIPKPYHIEGNSDRWAASQVNTVFRAAALRLPWKARWEGGIHRCVTSASSLNTLASLKSRTFQAWSMALADVYVEGYEQTLLNSAAVLSYALNTEELGVYAKRESTLSRWLHHTLVPLPGAQDSSSQGTTVLARLTSLSCLTSLSWSCRDWTDASWLTLLPQLRCIHLGGYDGPPLSGLPALEKLSVRGNTPVPLVQWASPRLTDLSFDYHNSIKCLPLSGYTGQRPSASGSEAREWLSRLQRLELSCWPLSIHHTGLRRVVPALTYLKLCGCNQELAGLNLLLSKGLPTGLKGLHLEGEFSVWSAIFELETLVSLEIQQAKELFVDDVAPVVSGLVRLPHLKHAVLRLTVSNSSEARVQEGFRALHALLLSRQGCLHLDMSPPPPDDLGSPYHDSEHDYSQ